MSDKNHVTQPLSARLKAAGWKTSTECSYFGESRILQPWNPYLPPSWLPAPSIGELREKLTKADFRDYWFKAVRKEEEYADLDARGRQYMMESDFSDWLYTVTASADALAEIWLSLKGKETP